MTWPKIAAKYPSKKKCPICGAGPYKAGEIIYKINEEYWCCNENCGRFSAMDDPDQKFPPNAVPKSLVQYHDDAWSIAFSKAETFYKSRDAYNTKDVMILAQVFYKGFMGIKS